MFVFVYDDLCRARDAASLCVRMQLWSKLDSHQRAHLPLYKRSNDYQRGIHKELCISRRENVHMPHRRERPSLRPAGHLLEQARPRTLPGHRLEAVLVQSLAHRDCARLLLDCLCKLFHSAFRQCLNQTRAESPLDWPRSLVNCGQVAKFLAW